MKNLKVHPRTDICLLFDNVSFAYNEVKALKNVSFHIHEGEFVTLVGPNGAGKTTTLKLILGLEKPDDGIVELFGERPSRSNQKAGYVPQNVSFDKSFPISVGDVARMGRLRPFSRKYTDEDKNAVDEALAALELTALTDRPYAALSGGERRRTLVARALAINPRFLVLDEPTANMDIDSEKRLNVALGRLKGKITILVVTHDRDFVSNLVDRVLCMGEGGVVQHEISGGDRRILHNQSASADDCYPGNEKIVI
ncbi:MAG: ATP-binding cassette domain-containing protein [Treponema sp.]|jgi:zinc transport system ATP-binding protein|nr:ATP-binding cassette domain-containing protein [Treponema sp.]